MVTVPETVTALEAAIGLFAGLAGLALIIYALLRAEMRHMRGEMLVLRSELRTEIKENTERLQGSIRETEERLSAGIKANAERIDAVEGKLGRLERKVSDLGERVAQVDGKLAFLYRFITCRNEPLPATVN